MLEKIIEYGTKHSVTVESSGSICIVVVADDIKEAFVLMWHGLKTIPNKGDKGSIVFKRGGPKKGYWQYYPNK